MKDRFAMGPTLPSGKNDVSAEISVKLFEFDLSLPTSEESMTCLASDERMRAKSLATERARQQYVSSRIAMRKVLSNELGCAPEKIVFRYNAWGKPELPDGLQFSLSHCDDFAVLAIGGTASLGLDIEGAKVLTRAEIEFALSPDEMSLVRQETLDDEEWLRLWVRKEAVLKALGKGLAHSPRSVSIGFGAIDYASPKKVLVVDEDSELVFRLIDIDLGPGKLGALARSGDEAFSCFRG